MKTLIPITLVGLLALFTVGGCSEEGPLSVASQVGGEAPNDAADESYLEGAFAIAADKSIEIIHQNGSIVPGEQVTVDFLGESATFYPYTANQLDESAMDPVNLIFVGEVDPVQIRSALMALDGDRTAFGFPAGYPFDQIWSDAVGADVQTAWVADEGWLGSVIQLTLGDYEPLRFHLRLFRTTESGWTLGGAHFEMLIPGTADHQVLHWELAKQIVAADLMRSGLLDVSVPLAPTGVIHQPDGFREIPAMIYNMLPPELTELIGVATPVEAPVPIPTDGTATILNVAQPAPLISGETLTSITINYDQTVPRPFCSDGPYDFLYVSGPVELEVWVSVNTHGRYRYRSSYAGTLDAVPIDIMTGEPCGAPFTADVGGRGCGNLSRHKAFVFSSTKRVTWEAGGPQILFTNLYVREGGPKSYRSFIRCLDEEALAGF